jgi:membrane protein DedA with SNARE-associated domain
MLRPEPWLVQGGLAVLCVLVFIKAAGIPIPIPGDLLIVAVGTLVSYGQVDFPVALGSLALATACGAFVLFGVVRRAGHQRVQRYGQRVGLTQARLGQAEQRVKTGGWWAITIGRTLPGVRLVTTVAAGLFEVPGRTFASATSVAAILEVGVCLLLGVLIGASLQRLADQGVIGVG